MGNSTAKCRNRFSTATKKAACDMYITGGDDLTAKMVADEFGMSTISLYAWLRDGGYPLKMAKRKPLPQTPTKKMRRDMLIVKRENGDLKYQIMNLNGQIEDLRESKRAFKDLVQRHRLQSLMQ